MDKSIMAFVIALLGLAAVVAMAIVGTIPAEAAIALVSLAVGGAVGYLFPSPLSP